MNGTEGVPTARALEGISKRFKNRKGEPRPSFIDTGMFQASMRAWVPAGFVTDLASVPRIFWTILPPDGKYAKAAIIHDYLYDNALRTKKEADLIFLDGMTVLGVPKWKRTVMYWAVRLFGRGMYGKEQNTVINGNGR
ncbi:DUF1353 domain-containing protein [Salmonella enterica]|nr:DUF1353 domain-containing protein [Salmonella enterica]